MEVLQIEGLAKTFGTGHLEVRALADIDVVTAYPIRPYDTVMQYVAKLLSNGEIDCEYIVAESEHSQFEIVKHASAVGARVFVGSSGVGWMYAFEALTVRRSDCSITSRTMTRLGAPMSFITAMLRIFSMVNV